MFPITTRGKVDIEITNTDTDTNSTLQTLNNPHFSATQIPKVMLFLQNKFSLISTLVEDLEKIPCLQ